VVSRQVPNGRGGTKGCNTSGTAAADGYPEHAFTWDVALHVRDALEAHGVRTTMTRDSDIGVGPCVDQRAALANAAKPDAIVSIHADGGPPSAADSTSAEGTRRLRDRLPPRPFGTGS
jgi:N-acetylmuramoyl-L-alanine amidase